MKQARRLVVGFSGFDWDAGNRRKAVKHGVPLVEIEGLFSGVICRIYFS